MQLVTVLIAVACSFALHRRLIFQDSTAHTHFIILCLFKQITITHAHSYTHRHTQVTCIFIIERLFQFVQRREDKHIIRTTLLLFICKRYGKNGYPREVQAPAKMKNEGKTI